ncbi:MAG: class I poly(R)-hydroxyalkanoic acid synthase [Aquabacterium sp.]|jgi:polyhydroxyalkanoate synthase|uniref:PHA/PHB synthase family protein n=1 Tax=Aquabacterium sp. TaxID=1872578 RepID=UPI002A35F012|nr:class I poly(R)-hydroxyalkanoic acid synthase [Aquabacterium sp.]MDX9843472.1 class I poly(R)-hydroxyalkanoic acid synthase [Aquabacterium sp.]
MAVPHKPRAARGAAKDTSAPQAETTATSAPQASAFEQMGAAFRLPGVDFESLKTQWEAQLSKLAGFSPELFQSWLQQSPTAGLKVPGLTPVKQAVEAVSQSVSGDLQSLAALKVDPDTLKTIQSEYLQRATELWNQALTQPEALTVKDRRFAAPEWSQSPASAFTASMYLLNAQTMQRLADSLAGAEKARERVRFAVQQWSAAMSPSNFLALNPEALKKAVETKGESIQHGIQHLLGDIRQGHLSMTDESVFEVGKNVATTPGTVVYENGFFQLIEYTPITAKVHATPFLFVPPCINKYYILDLQPDNSLVRHLLSEGHRVFMVSWVNPDESLAKSTWDDYIEHGVIQAIDVTREITGVEQINALGFCVGGTMLGTALAVLAAKGRKPVASLTLLTSFLDFAHTGILDIFIDEAMVRMREMTMGPDSPQGGGLMKGGDLASTFAFLRPNDLVWNYVVGNYLKGEMPPAFDLLYWNSDSTNLPGPYYAWYLRNTYLENNLIKPGAVTVCGEPLDLRRLDMPTFIYGSREDHIVPWESAYASSQVVTGPRTFVLGASGHIAGVINPPAKKKRSHWVTGSKVKQLPADANTWLASAEEQPGSWWTVWSDWLREHAGPMVAAPKQAGSRKYPAIEAAPGRYVLRKA